VTSPVGTYPISATLVDPDSKLANYTVTNAGNTLTIGQAPLLVTTNNKGRLYGAADPTFDGSISGIQNGDNITATYATTATVTSPVGTYPITATLVDPTSKLGNYAITNAGGTLTVSKATITVTAEDKTRGYGDPNPALTAAFTGFVNGETTAVLTGAPALSTTATPTSPIAVTYPITATIGSLSATNYQFAFVPGTMTLTPATLNILADNKTRQYGLANPTFTGSYNGQKNGETFSLSYSTPAQITSPIGTYDIVPAATGATLANYPVVPTNGTLTITTAPLSITADAKTRAFGVANPTLTGVIVGIRNSDPVTATYSTPAVIGSPVGTYTITPSLAGTAAAVLANYSVTINNNLLTVTPATTATAVALDPSTVQYSDQTTATATITGANADAQTAANLGGTVAFTLIDGATTYTLGSVTPTVVAGALTASGTYRIDRPEGSYTIRAVFTPTSTNISGSNSTASLGLTKEDVGSLAYIGSTAFSTGTTNNSATVTLAAAITDIADGSASHGRIQNALVDFRRDLPTGTNLANNVAVGFVTTGDTANGMANASSFTYTLSTSEVNDGGASITVYPVVDGTYYTGIGDPSVVTIAKPGADFVTGGGHIVIGSTGGNTNSAGTYAADAGSKTNFGFTMKYNKSGRNLQGQVNIIFRRTESDGVHIYQIKSNAINSLVVANVTGGRQATINTKANLTDVTDPINTVSLGGNLDLTLDAVEATATGYSDKIAITLKGTNLLYCSNWATNKAVLQTLGGGSIHVRTGAAKLVTFEEETEEPMTGTTLRQNLPNPFTSSTTISYSLATSSRVRLTVTNELGQVVTTLVDEDRPAGLNEVVWNPGTINGRPMPSGTYFYTIQIRSNETGMEEREMRQMILTR
jgi:hypothetical protein